MKTPVHGHASLEMSIDLAWDALIESSLAENLVDLLNRQLASTQRPSFIGPVTVHSFDFGTDPPDIEIVDIRDIYRDFLEDDEGENGVNNGYNDLNGRADDDDDDEFEWVPRKTAGMGLADDTPSYHHLPPHIRYGRGPATDPFVLSMSVPNLSSPSPHMLGFRSMHLSTPTTPFKSTVAPSPQATAPSSQDSLALPTQDASSESTPEIEHPNLQLHLRITHNSNLRLTLTTSLLINYPSPSFMSLPIKLSVTGLIFTGEVVLAYQGSRKRVHLCILDDLDPYGPASDRSSRPSSDQLREGEKPLPIGMRLLPSILIESEIGQADKHVLKNVTRVERFIQDVIRKTVEEELLFPNYHTIMLGES